MSSVKLSKKRINLFQKMVWDFYHSFGRSFPWRNVADEYQVVVSEVMLQQTQTFRVIEKFDLFITEFPTIYSLAGAQLRDVLSVWQGLGYNRRAKFLHQIAQKVVSECNGILPNDPQKLETFPGLGKATASSICAFAFNKCTVFIETNIRAVFIHTFFANQTKVSDKELLPLVEQTVDRNNPREWYYALMDYGVMLKREHSNPSRRSVHHTNQSKFEGSGRQVRGQIIRYLTHNTKLTVSEVVELISDPQQRVKSIINALVEEELIRYQDGFLFI